MNGNAGLSESQPLIRQPRKPMSAIEGRGLVLVTLGLLFASSVTAMPTLFYLWDPTTDNSNTEVHHCQSAHEVPIQDLIRSQCSTALGWNHIPATTNNTKKVSVLKCSFSDTEKAINRILPLLLSARGRKAQFCLAHAIPLVCNFLYRDCRHATQLTRQDCLAVKNNYCKAYWNLVTSAGIGQCLAAPNCEKDFPPNSSSSEFGISSTTNLFQSSDYYISPMIYGNTTANCTKPLVPTHLSNPDFPFACSPTCPGNNWASKSERIGLNVVLYLSAPLCWLCCVIAFITWAAVPKLRRFPQITPLFLTISYTISIIALSIPVILGRYTAFCSYKDAFSVMVDPTTACKVQGPLFHFGILSTSVWWFFWILNVAIVVYSKSPSNVISNHPRVLFIVEISVSVILPASMVGIVLKIGGVYTMASVDAVLCGPVPLQLQYFTFAIPLQIIVFSGSLLMAVVILRLRKSRAFRESCNSRIDSHLHNAIEKRFFMLIIAFPLCSGTILTTVSVAIPMFKKMIWSYLIDESCRSQPSQHQTCPVYHQKYHIVSSFIVAVVMFDICTIVVLLSTLLPAPARQFWRQHFVRIMKCCRKVPEDDGERRDQRVDNSTPVMSLVEPAAAP